MGNMQEELLEQKRSHTHTILLYVVQNIIKYTKLFFHSYNIDISIPSQKKYTVLDQSHSEIEFIFIFHNLSNLKYIV